MPETKKLLDELVSKGRAIFSDIYEGWITAIHDNDELGQKELEDFGLFQEVGRYYCPSSALLDEH